MFTEAKPVRMSVKTFLLIFHAVLHTKMPLYFFFYSMVQKSQQWLKTQIKGGESRPVFGGPVQFRLTTRPLACVAAIRAAGSSSRVIMVIDLMRPVHVLIMKRCVHVNELRHCLKSEMRKILWLLYIWRQRAFLLPFPLCWLSRKHHACEFRYFHHSKAVLKMSWLGIGLSTARTRPSPPEACRWEEEAQAEATCAKS